MKYTNIHSKTALHKLKPGRLPFDYDVNIYRGCAHGCIYCYAMYSHQYMQSDNYFNEIFIKQNISDILENELSKLKKKGIINLGGVCDSYQPIEIKTELMPAILRTLIKHKVSITISTKSDLILRDIELINELSKVASVHIAATITTMDESIRKKIEPRTISSERRFAMLKRMKQETNATVGVHLMPIIPYITDTRENLEQIYKLASHINVDYVLPGIMYLRGLTRKAFFTSIDEEFPHLSKKLQTMYSYKYDRKPYKKALYAYIHELRKKYNFKEPTNLNSTPLQNEQLKLF